MVNAANISMFVGVLYSVLPAMALLYVMLDRYEGFFDEKRVFKYLAIGLLVGALIVFIQILFLRFHDPGRLLATPLEIGLLLLAVGYPLLESASKVAVLNWRTVAGRRDAPYYGTSFGIGFGAILTFVTVAGGVRGFLIAPPTGVTHLEIVVFFALLFLLFLGGIMVHAVTGAVIGKMTGENAPLRALGWATVLGIPFYVGYYFLYTTGATTAGRFTILIPLGVLLYGVLAVRYTIRNILEEVVPEDLARQVRRDVRRKRREEGSD